MRRRPEVVPADELISRANVSSFYMEGEALAPAEWALEDLRKAQRTLIRLAQSHEERDERRTADALWAVLERLTLPELIDWLEDTQIAGERTRAEIELELDDRRAVKAPPAEPSELELWLGESIARNG